MNPIFFDVCKAMFMVDLFLFDGVFVVGAGVWGEDVGPHIVCAVVPAERDDCLAGEGEGGVVVEADGDALA